MSSSSSSTSTSSSCFLRKKDHRDRGCCPSSCSNSDSSCSSLSCLKDCGKNECMLVRQFLDFNPTGAVYVNRIIPVPCCQEVRGLPGSKNRLGMRFGEMISPFYVEVARELPCGHKGHKAHCHSSSSCSRTSRSKKSCKNSK